MKIICLVSIFLLAFNTYSQRFLFKSFSTSEGLAQSQVNSICQDSIGYLWVGTLGGVSRYNGNTFKNYSTDNGLFNNRINVVKWIDSKIFIGHQGGISIFDKDKITTIALPKKFHMTNVTDFIIFNQKVIVATNGAGLFEVIDQQLKTNNLLQDDYAFIRDLLVWKNELYFATRGGMVRTKDLSTSEYFLQNKEISISSLAIRGDLLIISSFYDGLLFYNKEQNRIVKTLFEKDGYLFNHVLVDFQNNIWISTSNGVIKYNEKEQSFIDNTVGLPLNVISTAYEDTDHNIWFGSQGKGLVKASNGNICYFDKSTGLPSDIVLSGFQSAAGDYYFGTMDGGVLKTSDFKKFSQINIDPTVWCAIPDVGGLHWFGTKYGLYSIDKNDQYKLYDLEDGAPGFKITAFYKIDSRSMYIGGSHGVVKYIDGAFIPIGDNSGELGTIRNITYFNGKLYVATDLGLYLLAKNNKFELISQLNRTVFSIAQLNNRLFFGTEDGLYEMTGNNESVRIRFSVDVASNYINFLSANSNELIVGTNNGVYLINVNSKKNNVKRIGTSDGLIDPETNINSSFIDNHNRMWFGTASGLVQLDLKSLNRKAEIVRLKLDKILLNYEWFDYKKFDGELKGNIPQNMVFPYNKNNLQFYLDGVSLNNFEDLSFQFKVQGLDDTWMPPSKTPYLTLSGLPAGNYVLHARALLEDGTVVDNISIAFKVKPAFYKTWWFLSLIGFVIVALILGWVQLRIKREKEKNELERAEFKTRLITLEQQSLNASMNRHFIFNSLNSIQYFINISDKISANKYLSNFAKLIRKNLDSSTEENGLVTLAEEMERIDLYLSLESMRFKDKFVFEVTITDVDTESILIPAMMVQPFVENSIIHGVLPQIDRVGKIQIDIKREGNFFVIEISDNGIGIEKSMQQKANFSGDHRSQGMEITVKRINILKKISDREIELIGPQQLNDDNGNILGTIVKIKILRNNLED